MLIVYFGDCVQIGIPTKHNKMEPCEDCRSTLLVEYRGDIVCSRCGLVKSEYCVFDDTCDYKMFHESDVPFKRQCQQNRVTKRANHVLLRIENTYKKAKYKNEYKKILVEKLCWDDDIVALCCEWFEITIESSKNQIKLQRKTRETYIFVACAYCASVYLKRGYDVYTFCDYFGVMIHKFWDILYIVQESWKDLAWYKELKDMMESSIEIIKRKVYEMTFIPMNDSWNVIKDATKLYKKVHNYGNLTSVKRKTLHASCIYIACKLHKVDITKDDFCKKIDVSPATLNTQEHIIQKALTSSKGQDT